jgi:hypothetical protein
MLRIEVTQFLSWGYLVLITSMGLAALCAGIYMLLRAPVNQGTISFFRRRWGLDSSVDDITVRAALRVLVRINAWALIFVGVGVTMISIVWLCIAWFSKGSFLNAGFINIWMVFISIIVTMVILACAGHAYGIRRMRAMANTHTAHGDLHPRRVRDYVSIWMGVAVVIWLLALVILTVAAFLFANVPLRIRLGFDQWGYLPLGSLGLLVIPLLAAIYQALGLGLLRWMVALPRLKSLDEIPDVGVFDVDLYIRRESIYFVLQSYSSLMFFSFMIQSSFVMYNAPHRSMPMITVIAATMMVNVIIYLAIIMGLLSVRLAGSLRRGSAPVAP